MLPPIHRHIAARKHPKLWFVQRRGPSHATINSAASATASVIPLAAWATQKNVGIV